METSIIFNIKSSKSDVMSKPASTIASKDRNKTEKFNSAFNDQMQKKSKQAIEKNENKKDLPQNGNALPKNKNKINDDENHETENNNIELENKEKSKIEIDIDKSDEEKLTPIVDHVENNTTNFSIEDLEVNSANSSVLTTPDNHIQSPIIEQEFVKNVNQQLITEDIQKPITESSNKLVSEDELLSSGMNSSIVAAQSGVVSNTDLGQKQNVLLDKLNTKFSKEDIPTTTQWTSTPLKVVKKNQNKTNLSKNIADFQQYIESSRKQANISEPINSVKSFEQAIKIEQTNVQTIPVDTKVNMTTNQLQPVTLVNNPILSAVINDRINTHLNTTQINQNLEVKTPMGKSQWNKNFSKQIVMMANKGMQMAKIKLNPMSLGPVEAMVKLSGETAVVNLTSLHLTTKEALENAIPRLKEMLNENGFSQVDVNVAHQDKQQQEANFSSNTSSNTSSNNEHGKSTMPGEEQLSEESYESELDANAPMLDEQGLTIVDYYA